MSIDPSDIQGWSGSYINNFIDIYYIQKYLKNAKKRAKVYFTRLIYDTSK